MAFPPETRGPVAVSSLVREKRWVGTLHLANCMRFGGSVGRRSHGEKPQRLVDWVPCAGTGAGAALPPRDACHATQGGAGPAGANVVGCHTRSPSISRIYPGRVSIPDRRTRPVRQRHTGCLAARLV